MDSWQLKMFSAGLLSKFGFFAGKVKMFTLFVCAVAILLGFIEAFFSPHSKGIICLMIGLMVGSLELVEYISLISRILKFYYESYFSRALLYAMFSIPVFFSWVTAAAGIGLLLSSLAFVICAVKGEKPSYPEEISDAEGQPIQASSGEVYERL